MGNSISERIVCNREILIEVMLMLDAEDQLALTRIHGNIEEAFVEHIWKRYFKLDSNIIEFNENFRAFIEKNCKKLTTLSVNGGQVPFNWQRLETLTNLTEICLNYVSLSVADIYSMARIATKLEILKLQNIDYRNSYFNEVGNFKVESLKKLHLQYLSFDRNLRRFIEYCPNLEELILYKIEDYDIDELNHSLLSRDIIKSTLNEIAKDHDKVCECICDGEMNFEIIAKKDHTTIVNIQTITLDLHRYANEYIEHFNLIHLENVKELHLAEPFMNDNTREFIKLVANNCKQVKILDCTGTRGLINGLNINALDSLKRICISMVPTAAEDLFRILQDLNLYALELDCDIFCNGKSVQNCETYGNSVKVLECYGFYEMDLKKFFELYPNGFQNLQQLCLNTFRDIESMMQLALKHFRYIKYLSITDCNIMNEKILTKLIQFPVLKYLKIHKCPDINPDHIQYLRQHIAGVVIVD